MIVPYVTDIIGTKGTTTKYWIVPYVTFIIGTKGTTTTYLIVPYVTDITRYLIVPYSNSCFIPFEGTLVPPVQPKA